MEVSVKKRKSYCKAALLLCAVFSAVLFLSCDGTTSINPQKTDVVTITDINSRITDADAKAGVLKTNNFVGSVKMSHVKHEGAGMKCVQCHHKVANDDRAKQCAACHKGDKGRDLMHNFCIDCHSKSGKGPVMCQNCHQY